jgi:transposase-like protein
MTDASSAIDLPSLLDAYDTGPECRAYLEELRWPTGVACPRCSGETISRIRSRRVFECDGCGYQFSVTAGTLFHDSHLPLPKWFLAIFLMCEAKKGISANQLKRMLKISYKTAWYLSHRIRAAMTGLNPQPRTGTVNLDEDYIGAGRRMGRGISEKHLDRYLDEFEFRFNNRTNPHLFRDVLLRLMDAKAMPYGKLIA